MLTIDHNKKITIQQRDKGFSKTLFQAFFLAVLIHAGAFFFFKVKPITLSKSIRRLPPISVVMDIKGFHLQDIAAWIQDDPLPEYSFPKRPHKKPSLSTLEPSSYPSLLDTENKLIATKRKKSFFYPPFKEQKERLSSFLLLGALQDRKIVKEIPCEKLSSVKVKQTVRYSLTIDDQTGAIVWISPTDELALLISDMKFNALPNGTLSKGILEVQAR